MPSPKFSDILSKVSNFDFQYETAKYHPKIALTLSKASKLAYFEPDEVIPFVKQNWQLNDCQFLNEKETQAYLMMNDQVIIVAFRGSTERDDWFDNFKCVMPVPDAFGKVHPGFRYALDHLWQKSYGKNSKGEELRFLDYIKQLQLQNPRSLWFTGHSLGGALATLAAARLREKDIPVYGLYTFGSPRVGDRNFERTFNADFKSKNFRFVNNNDTVTRIPPRELGYSHAGTFLYFTAKGELKSDPYFWLQFLDSVQGSVDDFMKPGLDCINDHCIDLYINNLVANLNTFPTL
ncbi:MAG: hypothetical protein B0A82_19210 [Alkalinema sp. CACIAM 70d]|nr:MAG: hypothetical protein B0A82_19210 [Alkalinema sp. CACIAM 70d]